MVASLSSAPVLIRDALTALAAVSAVSMLLLPATGQAATPGARTTAMTALEEALIVTPDLEPIEGNRPVVAYLRLTEDGWRLDMVPGAVPRTGPLPMLTTTADSALENFTTHSIAPYIPLLRVDF